MSRFLSKKALEMTPYVPGEQPKDKKYIKLNTNECPYPPSPKVLSELNKNITQDLRLYPDPECTFLLEKASEYYNVSQDMIFPGNGSDEILAFAFAAFYWGKKVMFPEITYTFYPVYCDLFNVEYSLTQMKDNKIDINEYLSCNKGMIIANPNAPTGEVLSIDEIEKVVANNPENLILIDEAYIDFGGTSCIPLVNRYDNILVVQTFSKSRALAGLRIGLAFGNRDLIKGLNTIKNSINSYTVNRLSQAAAVLALSDDDYYNDIQYRIISTRENTTVKLKEMGFITTNSMSNFIFASHSEVKASEIYLKLKQAGILVRHFNKPKIDNYIRITVGTDNEMDILIKSLDSILKGDKII